MSSAHDSPRLKIVIGIPCYAEVAPEVLEDYMTFAYHCGRRLPQYDFFLAIKSKHEQFRARNTIVEASRQVGADYLLMLDDDMIVDPLRQTLEASDSYNLVHRLISHRKPICGALYYQRHAGCLPVLMTRQGDTGYRFLRDDEITHGLQRVDVAGGGCLLIDMKVFGRLKQPFFEPEYVYGTDVQLCRAAAEAGFEVWADTGIEIGHVRQERTVITSRNRGQYQMQDSVSGDVTHRFISSDLYAGLIEDACRWTGFKDLDELRANAQSFMQARRSFHNDLSDYEWYRCFPMERVARQVWFNHDVDHKRRMTEFILATINHSTPLDILDFGCGIGIPAFDLARRGHRVTACDIDGTGTFEFLKWRSKEHGVPMTFHGLRGSAPHLGGAKYDVIIAMDCLEHIADWRTALRELSSHLKPNGILFANNAILDDTTHPEHYDLKPKDFLSACVASDLRPLNSITYVKSADEMVAAPVSV